MSSTVKDDYQEFSMLALEKLVVSYPYSLYLVVKTRTLDYEKANSLALPAFKISYGFVDNASLNIASMTASEQKAFLQPAMLTKINFNMTTAWLTIPLIILSWLIIVFIFDRLIHEKNKHAKRMALKM